MRRLNVQLGSGQNASQAKQRQPITNDGRWAREDLSTKTLKTGIHSAFKC